MNSEQQRLIQQALEALLECYLCDELTVSIAE
jgi:hypothetical protein